MQGSRSAYVKHLSYNQRESDGSKKEAKKHAAARTLNDKQIRQYATDERLAEGWRGVSELAQLAYEQVERIITRERAANLIVIGRAVGLSCPPVEQVLRFSDEGQGTTGPNLSRPRKTSRTSPQLLQKEF